MACRKTRDRIADDAEKRYKVPAAGVDAVRHCPLCGRYAPRQGQCANEYCGIYAWRKAIRLIEDVAGTADEYGAYTLWENLRALAAELAENEPSSLLQAQTLLQDYARQLADNVRWANADRRDDLETAYRYTRRLDYEYGDVDASKEIRAIETLADDIDLEPEADPAFCPDAMPQKKPVDRGAGPKSPGPVQPCPDEHAAEEGADIPA